MNKVKMEVLDREPRPFKGKTSIYELTNDEREEFIEKRIQVIKDCDVATETQKQVALLRSGFSAGLSTAAAFTRYVEGDEYWHL